MIGSKFQRGEFDRNREYYIWSLQLSAFSFTHSLNAPQIVKVKVMELEILGTNDINKFTGTRLRASDRGEKENRISNGKTRFLDRESYVTRCLIALRNEI